MPKSEIDKLFASVEEPKRSTLEEMRRRIIEVVPDAEQTIKYGMAAFLHNGKIFACLAPFKNHINWSPYSSEVLVQIESDLSAYVYSKASLRFSVDKPLPKTLVKKLIRVRLAEIELQKVAKIAKKAKK